MIVSDSTTLIALINIDRFDILEFFRKPIIITQEVYDEVSVQIYAKKVIDLKTREQILQTWSVKDKTIQKELKIVLDAGEASSIAIAIENKLPLIIDEKKGRKIAKNLGVEVVGLIGILKFLYKKRHLQENETLKIIDELKTVGFYITNDLATFILGE